jgi:hypothetical protein
MFYIETYRHGDSGQCGRFFVAAQYGGSLCGELQRSILEAGTVSAKRNKQHSTLFVWWFDWVEVGRVLWWRALQIPIRIKQWPSRLLRQSDLWHTGDGVLWQSALHYKVYWIMLRLNWTSLFSIRVSCLTFKLTNFFLPSNKKPSTLSTITVSICFNVKHRLDLFGLHKT